MTKFVLQYKDINVVIVPKFNEEENTLKFKIIYDKEEIMLKKINEEDFKNEIKELLGQ